MKKYASIKQLVIDETISNGEFPSLENLSLLVKENFPNSKWQKTHYDWYKSQIKTGKIELDELLNSVDFDEDNNSVDENMIEFSLSLERDLQNYLSTRLNEIEENLTLVGKEFGTSAGFIDILAKDKLGNFVVIELKAGKAKDASIGQILGYIGALIDMKNTNQVRGIIVASDFDNRLLYASKAISNLSLVKYSLNFKFSSVGKG